MNTQLPKPVYDALVEIGKAIDWDNWCHPVEEGEPTRYWKVSEVLYARLDWLLQEVEKNYPDEDNHSTETIYFLKNLISAVAKCEPNRD